MMGLAKALGMGGALVGVLVLLARFARGQIEKRIDDHKARIDELSARADKCDGDRTELRSELNQVRKDVHDNQTKLLGRLADVLEKLLAK